MLPTDHQPLALPSGELSSGCETERVCVAAFARCPLMLLLAVLSMLSPRSGEGVEERSDETDEGGVAVSCICRCALISHLR